ALILGRPRPLSGHRRAGPPRDVRYTLICEEPRNPAQRDVRWGPGWLSFGPVCERGSVRCSAGRGRPRWHPSGAGGR
ncbi:hypothetical protein EFN30_11030, partial [Propionibacterium freudenreichii]|nr:hypothetical protein [Propionibacterium freudenreichii]MCT3016400.1 hypothetical protein [Propionibacterium freudenreichii]